MPAAPKSESEIAADRILLELPKRDRRLAQFLTKEFNRKQHQTLQPLERKIRKIQILGAINRPLLEEIVASLAAAHGPAGKSSISPKSMISFIERMPHLKGDEVMQYQEMFGGNYKSL